MRSIHCNMGLVNNNNKVFTKKKLKVKNEQTLAYNTCTIPQQREDFDLWFYEEIMLTLWQN